MRILIVAATEAEFAPLPGVERLITGVGMVNTAMVLTERLARMHQLGPIDLAINVGVAGAFNHATEVPSVFQVITDRFADLGVEDGEIFIGADQIGLVAQDDWHLQSTYLLPDLHQAHAITVNTVHGHEPSIEKVVGLYNPDLESMEGAAFFAVCKRYHVPAAQIRAVSNHVERRDRSKWKMQEAIASLNQSTKHIIQLISA